MPACGWRSIQAVPQTAELVKSVATTCVCRAALQLDIIHLMSNIYVYSCHSQLANAQVFSHLLKKTQFYKNTITDKYVSLKKHDGNGATTYRQAVSRHLDIGVLRHRHLQVLAVPHCSIQT